MSIKKNKPHNTYSKSKNNDVDELNPATNKPLVPRGIAFFDNEKKTYKEIWFANSDVRKHYIIFGNTSSGLR